MLKDGVIRDLLARLKKSNSSVSAADLEDLILGLAQIELKVDAGVALQIISLGHVLFFLCFSSLFFHQTYAGARKKNKMSKEKKKRTGSVFQTT